MARNDEMDKRNHGAEDEEFENDIEQEEAEQDKETKDKKGKKKSKKGELMNVKANKVTGFLGWCETKVRKYPKMACTAFFTIGTVVGVVGKTIFDAVTGKDGDDGTIETDFVPSETDSDTPIDTTDTTN